MRRYGKNSNYTRRANKEGEGFDLDALIARILSGEVSLFDLLCSAPTGNYWAFVQSERLLHALSHRPKVLQKLVVELNSKIVEEGGNPDEDVITRELKRKAVSTST